ncbi:MAG: methyltransferase domain-containing protein [Parvibaculum sp.]|uniref:class I SAM-dependent methyltransferase n=1 Tax=Parvibaculum sp. TaxID=2024848 RepID=UPI00349FD3C1
MTPHTADKRLSNDGPNAEQIEYWNGDAGERWARYQDKLDGMLRPFSDALLQIGAVESGDRIMDIGCGCGATTFDLASRAGAGGRTIGVDISAPMIARARHRATALESTAEFMLADAATHAFAPGSFDLLASRFGIMFFRDQVSAFTHMRKALAPDGHIAFVCWRTMKENPWISIPLFAALPHIPKQEPAIPGAPGPFAFDDPDRFRGVLTDAGYKAIEIEPFDAELAVGGGADPLGDALQQTMDIGPLARIFKELNESQRARTLDAVREALAHHADAERVVMGGAVWLVTARA